MVKTRTQYVCQTCGSTQPKWVGRCPDCGEWNSLVETVVSAEPKRASAHLSLTPTSAPQSLPAIPSDNSARLVLPLPEFSRVLGGGIVPGSVVLVGGDPGIGKSTLLLQMASLVAQSGASVLYVSGEESAQQIKLRAERLGIADANLYVLAEVNLEQILAHMEQMHPRLTIVDSIQSVYTEELTGAAGAVGQVRECASQLLRFAKSNHTPVFLVGHVTKTGVIAGPRVLEHIVDTVLYLEGERFQSYRLLRSVKKPLRLDQRDRRLRDGRERPARGDESFGRVPGRTPAQCGRQRHRRNIRRDAPAAGGSAGAHLDYRLRRAAAHG